MSAIFDFDSVLGGFSRIATGGLVYLDSGSRFVALLDDPSVEEFTCLGENVNQIALPERYGPLSASCPHCRNKIGAEFRHFWHDRSVVVGLVAASHVSKSLCQSRQLHKSSHQNPPSKISPLSDAGSARPANAIIADGHYKTVTTGMGNITVLYQTGFITQTYYIAHLLPETTRFDAPRGTNQ